MAPINRQLALLFTSAILTIASTVLAEQAAPAPGGPAAAGRGPAAMKRGKGAQYGPEYRLNLMSRNLGLSEEQRVKIKPILEEEFTQLEALRSNDTFNRDQRRTRLQELNKVTSEKIRSILTPEQLKKHDEVKKTIADNRSKKRSTRPGPNPGENDPESRMKRLTQDIGLTADQQSKIKPILLEEFGKLEAMRGNDTYNREQRRAMLLELNEGTAQKIKAVLTPEQQAKYDAIRQKILDRRSQTKIPVQTKP